MDTIRDVVLVEEVQVHLQEEQTQTLIVCLLKRHLFSLIHRGLDPCGRASLGPLLSAPMLKILPIYDVA